MEDIHLTYSKHCQSVVRNGKTVMVEVYGTGNNDWILEVVDEYGNSTVWDDPFNSDDDAFQEFQRTLNEEGIESMIGRPP